MRYAEIIDRSPPRYPFVARVTLESHNLAAFEAAIKGYPQACVLGHGAIDAHRIGCTSAELCRQLERPTNKPRA